MPVCVLCYLLFYQPVLVILYAPGMSELAVVTFALNFTILQVVAWIQVVGQYCAIVMIVPDESKTFVA
jgi:hypothetical protein